MDSAFYNSKSLYVRPGQKTDASMNTSDNPAFLPLIFLLPASSLRADRDGRFREHRIWIHLQAFARYPEIGGRDTIF